MIIHSENIEKWIFDYFEGNLTVLEKVEFENYILEHPEFHADFKSWKQSYENADDDKIPAFAGSADLLVSVPFYQSTFFQWSAGVLALLLFGSVIYFNIDQSRVYKDHLLNGNLSVLSINGDISYSQLELDNISSFTHSYISFNIANQRVSYEGNADNNYVYSNQISHQNNGFENAEVGVETNSSLTAFLESDSGTSMEVYSSFSEKEQNQTEELIAQISPLTPYLEEVIEDEKTLFEHLGIKRKKYDFLNFNNDKVKGLGSDKHKRSAGGENYSLISQSHPQNKANRSEGKKRKGIFAQLKYLELGLENINDPILSITNYNPVVLNPALAGQLGVSRLKTNVRAQWMPGDFTLFTGSTVFDTYIEKIQAGVGFATSYTQDKSGTFSARKHDFVYAQKFNINKNANLSVALDYSLVKVNVPVTGGNNKYEIFHGQLISQSALEGANDKWRSNLGVSSWYSGKYFYGGFSVTNLLNTSLTATHEQKSNGINNMNYSLQLGTDYKKSLFANTVISPFVVMNKIGSTKEFWGGAAVRFKSLVTGLSVSDKLSAKALLGVQGNRVRFTYSADIAQSILSDTWKPSHEISFRILIGNKQNNWSRYDN